MAECLNKHFNTHYSTSQIYRALDKHNLTRKILERHAREQNPGLRNEFIELMSNSDLISPEMLVFVDETHCTEANARRKYGWAECGEPGVSAIASLTVEGIMSVTTANIVDGDVFIAALKNDILPCMNAYPAPRSVLVLDNASVHLKPAIMNECQMHGVICLFLPPYSYDLNPIERVFHCAKHWLREQYPDDNPNTPLRERLYFALTNPTITSDKICNIFVKCCIPISEGVRQWAAGNR
jgi:hypothetical protein